MDAAEVFVQGTPGQRQEYLVKQLAVLRERNDGPLDPIETANVRGQITLIKTLLGLAKPPAPVGEPHLGYQT